MNKINKTAALTVILTASSWAGLLLSQQALAAPVSYQFTTSGVGLETRNFAAASADQRLYMDTSIISGQFVYDGAGDEAEGFPGVYLALPSLEGSADGDLFSYTLGLAVVQDDAPTPAGCGDPPAPACAGVQDRLILTNFDEAGDFSGYTKTDGQMAQFELVNVAIFWVDGDGSAIDGLGLPPSLPPASFCPGGLEQCGQVRLDFVEVGADTIHAVFGAGFSLTVIPVPPAVLLFGSALGWLGWLRCVRRPAA